MTAMAVAGFPVQDAARIRSDASFPHGPARIGLRASLANEAELSRKRGYRDSDLTSGK